MLFVPKLVFFLDNIDNLGFKFYYVDLLVLSKSAYCYILPLSWNDEFLRALLKLFFFCRGVIDETQAECLGRKECKNIK